MARTIKAAILGIVICGAAWAHGSAQWIADANLQDPVLGLSCCGTVDCEAMDPADIEEKRGGYLVKPTGEIIPHERIIRGTPDGKPWRCRFMWDSHSHKMGRTFRKDETRCLIMPDAGV